MLINILIIFFLVLIIIQIILANSSYSLIEGFSDNNPNASENKNEALSQVKSSQPVSTLTQQSNIIPVSQPTTQPTPTIAQQNAGTYSNDPLILSKTNAADISFLKEQVNSLIGLNSQVQDLDQNVTNLSQVVNGIVTQNQALADSVSSSQKPVEITGIGGEAFGNMFSNHNNYMNASWK